MEIVKIVILSLSSLLLVFVGLMRLFNPINTYEKNSGIKLANDTDLLNEMRGVSAVMLCGGLLVALGIFVPMMTFSSHIVGSLIFIGFLIGRLVSMSADGKPNKQIVQGIYFELMFGGANVYGLYSTLSQN